MSLNSDDHELISAKEAAKITKMSLSWLAKARMHGDGPPYLQFGRAVRYSEASLLQNAVPFQHWLCLGN